MTGQALLETRGYRDQRGSDLLTRFADLLSIPCASDDPGGLDRNAIWIRDSLNTAGARAAVTQVPGMAPIVFGRIDGEPGGPLLGIYGRFDSRPREDGPPAPGPVLTDATGGPGGRALDWPRPGEPIDRDWLLRCDGSVARAPVAALVGALEARAGRTPEATLILLLEAEAGIGSLHLPDYLSLLGGRLSVDLWVALDGGPSTGEPPLAMVAEIGSAGRVFDAAKAAAGRPAKITGLPGVWPAVRHLVGLGAPVMAAPVSGGSGAGAGETLPIGDLWYAMDLVAGLLG